MKRTFLPLCLCLFFVTLGHAQQFGAFPPSTRWRQINTDTARIVFEAPIDSSAQNIAAILHTINTNNPTSLGNQVRKITTVLHKNSTLANGYVALGPFRSEYYLIPPSDIFEFGATPWSQTLAVHEYRHVHQYSNFNKGVSKVASVLFGQEGQALFNAISVPDWFFEGDAVHAETIQTAQGRGRAPNFFNGFKSLWREGRNYNWMKLRNGSLKDFVPNHYPLGYLLVNYGYQQYGNDFWRKVTADALSFKGLPGLFTGNIKRVSGVPFRQFRKEAFATYQHEVSTRRDAVIKQETVTDYLFPQQIGEDSLLYLKRSYRQLPAFYVRDNKGEHRLKLRHISNEDWFSYRNGSVVYTAFNTNARWGLINYSNIILLDIATGNEKRITQEGRYFTPDISADGSRLIAVSFNDSLKSELHLLSRDGELLNVLKAPGNDLFVHPRFIDNDAFVVAVRASNSTMSLLRGSFSGGKWQTLVPAVAASLGYPFIQANRLYFTASPSGNDEVYSIDLDSATPFQTVRQLTSNQTGNYFPSLRNDTLTWSNFTSNGYRIRQSGLLALPNRNMTSDIFLSRVPPFRVSVAESAPTVLKDNERSFATAPYKQTTGLFNFHSWRPDFTDPEITVSAFSDNYLNTFSSEIFYRYNINETSHGVGFNSFYGGLFPVLVAGIDYTFNRTIRSTNRTYTANQQEASFGFQVPLNLTSGKTFKFFNGGTSFVYNQLSPSGIYKNTIQGTTNTYLRHQLSFSQQLPRARQHIFPKAGYLANLQHRHIIGGRGYQFLGGTTLYLPSIRNHSIVVAGNFQERDTGRIIFSNRFANARGYNDFYFSRMWRLSGNYHMPLLYPDAGIPGVLYFLRVRSNFFYDYSLVYSNNKSRTAEQRSIGGELYFDTKFFNAVPITFGLRVSHLIDDDFSGSRPAGRNIFELIVPVDLIPR